MLTQLATILPYLIYLAHWDTARNAWVQMIPVIPFSGAPLSLVDGDSYMAVVSQTCTILYYRPDGSHYEIVLDKVTPNTNTFAWQVKPLAAAPAFAHVVAESQPSTAWPGDTITCRVTITNTGGSAGLINCSVRYVLGDSGPTFVGDWRTLQPGGSGVWIITLPMPSGNIRVYVVSSHQQGTPPLPVLDESLGPYTVTEDASELSNVDKPDWLKSALDSSVLNIVKGSWFSLFGIDVPPFSFEPGHWIESGLDLLLVPVNFLVNAARSVAIKVKDAFDKAWEVAGRLDDIVSSWADFVSSHITDWWAGVWVTVQSYVTATFLQFNDLLAHARWDIVTLGTRVTNLAGAWDSWVANFFQTALQHEPFRTLSSMTNTAYQVVQALPAELHDFFLNPAGWIFDKIDDWLNEEV